MQDRARKVLPSRSMPVTMDRLHAKPDRHRRIWRPDELGHGAFGREGVRQPYDFDELLLAQLCGQQRMIDVLTSHPENDYHQASLYWTMNVTAPEHFDQKEMPRHVFWMTVFRVQRVLKKLGLQLTIKEQFCVLLKVIMRPNELRLHKKNVSWVRRKEAFVATMLNVSPMACTLFLSPNSAFDQLGIMRRLFGLFLVYQVAHQFAVFHKLRAVRTLDSPTPFDSSRVLPEVHRGWSFVKGLIFDCAYTQAPQETPRLVTALEHWFCVVLLESDWISRIQEDMLKSMVSCRAINVSAARALYLAAPSVESASIPLNQWCYVDVGSTTFENPDHLCVRANTAPWGGIFGFRPDQSGQTVLYAKLSRIIRKSLVQLYQLDGNVNPASLLPSIDDNFDLFGDFYPRSGAVFDHRQCHCSADMVTYYTTGLPTLGFSAALFVDMMNDVERKMIESLLYMPEPIPYKF